MPTARPWRRGQAPQPRSGAPKAPGLTAAITVAAPSSRPSIVPDDSTRADTPIKAFATSRIYTSLTDTTPERVVIPKTPQDYRSRAAACDELGDKATSHEVRVTMRYVAARWRELADGEMRPSNSHFVPTTNRSTPFQLELGDCRHNDMTPLLVLRQ